MEIAVLCGGVGAARLLTALSTACDPTTLNAIVNVGDDETLHGLYICPDLDTITYTLSAAIDPHRGWGLSGETWKALEALRSYAAANSRPDLGWFALGDQDLGTHLYRTSRLDQGATLSQVTHEIAIRWGLSQHLLPATDQQWQTKLTTSEGAILSFQEYFVREQHQSDIVSVDFVGAQAQPTPAVLDALQRADAIVIAPSNPIISIDPILSLPEIRSLVASRKDRVIAMSPLINGAALKGPADRLMQSLGKRPDSAGIAQHYSDLASHLIIDDLDCDLKSECERFIQHITVTDTNMSNPPASRHLGSLLRDFANG